MASIAKRGDLQWRARVRRRGFPVQTRTFETKARAEAWVRQVEGEMDRGVFVSRRQEENTSLAEALTRYQSEVTAKKKGFAEETSVLTMWRAHPLACHMIGTIRSQDLAPVRDQWLKQGFKSGTVVRRFAILSHVFTIARREWGMASLNNPIHDIRLPTVDNARDRRLVGDEQERLEAAAQVYGGEIGSIITWAIETAMRRSEIAKMRWGHLDRKARVLLIPETKNGTPRRIPLSPRALAVLPSAPPGFDPAGVVWTLGVDAISRAFCHVRDAVGITELRFHDLRHEATSRLFEKGLNPMEVAAITGHKTLQMLKRYTHLRAEDLVGRLG